MQHAATPVVEPARALLRRASRSIILLRRERIRSFACALVIAGIAITTGQVAHASVPVDTLYAAGFEQIMTVDQTDGSITPLALQPGMMFFALAFDSAGRLFAVGCTDSSYFFDCEAAPDRQLMELDPVTGEVVDIIGSITDGSGSTVPIATLSVQPDTDVLFGFLTATTSPYSAEIWTIDKSTAAATRIASEIPAGCAYWDCSSGNAFAFAPDGTLYHVGWDRSVGPSAGVLMTVDPGTGAAITSVPLDSPGGWAVAPLAARSDGTLFSSYFQKILLPRPCRTCPPPDPPFAFLAGPVLTIDPLTGAVASVGAEGLIAGLDFSRVVVEPVDLDIEPGGDPNPINLADGGVVPVAILGSDTFDVSNVDVATLAFGPDGAAPAHCHGPHVEDVDGDGLLDLLAHYQTEEIGIAFGDMDACVTGETLDGTLVKGCDAVRTVPDMDGDGLLDPEEAAFGTDELDPASDGDGFTDGDEVLVLRTDPLNAHDPTPARARRRLGGRHRR